MLRASDIGNHSPHNVGNENDPLVRRSRWLNDSFPGLLLPDQIWGEAIKASRLWEDWSPTGLVRDPVIALFFTLIFCPFFSTLSPTHSFTSFTVPLLSLFSTLFSRYQLAIRLTTLTNSYDLMTIPFILFLFFLHTRSFDEMRTR